MAARPHPYQLAAVEDAHQVTLATDGDHLASQAAPGAVDGGREADVAADVHRAGDRKRVGGGGRRWWLDRHRHGVAGGLGVGVDGCQQPVAGRLGAALGLVEPRCRGSHLQRLVGPGGVVVGDEAVHAGLGLG
jgi:hypothetical protein